MCGRKGRDLTAKGPMPKPTSSQLPHQVAASLAQNCNQTLRHAPWFRIRPRRNINWANALMLQQLPNAKYMVSIAHSHTTVKAVGAHDHGDAHGRFGGVAALRLSDQIALRDSAMHE